MPSFQPSFLAELKAVLLKEGHDDLASQVESLEVCEFVEGRRPVSQFIYVLPKNSLPSGELKPRLILDGVPGLLCLLLNGKRIAIVETLSRDVLVKENAQ